MKTLLSAFLFLICIPFANSQELDTQLENYLLNAQYQKALAYIDSLQPSKELLNKKSYCYKALRNYPAAIDILKSLSKEYPEDVPVKLELASCYELALRFMDGVRCYDELIKLDSTNTYLKIQRADLLFQSERTIPALNQYLKMDNKNESSYVNRRLGMCYEKLNQVDSALTYYSKALALDSTDIYSAISVIKLRIKKEEYMTAIKESNAFISKDSTNAQMNVLNAFAYYSIDNYDGAVKRFEKCRVAGDSSLMVNRGLGISYYFLENSKCAQPYLKLAYAQDTTNNTVLYPLAFTSYELGYYQEAIDYYKTLLKRNLPNDARLYTFYSGLAKSFEGIGQYQNASLNYAKALAYGDMRQKMELGYMLANMYEEKLQNYQGAYVAFQQYRVALTNYQTNLKDSAEIQSIEEKLIPLDKHIEELKEKSSAQFYMKKSNTPSTQNVDSLKKEKMSDDPKAAF